MSRPSKLTNIKDYGNNISRPNDKNVYDRYIREITNLKPISREEEVELFKRIKATGDRQAIEKICKHNLLFVVSVAKRYAAFIGQSSVTLEDLISEGNLGLYTAIEKFDYTTGNKFISYAVWWIRQAILSSIQYNIKSIRLPANVKGEINKINRKEEHLEQLLGRTPSTIEIWEAMVEDGDMIELGEGDTSKRGELHKREFKIDELKKMGRFETSLNLFAGDDNTLEIGDMVKCDDLTPDNSMILKERRDLTLAMLSKIPPRAQDFIRDYYGIDTEPMTFKAIGEKYDVTAETVRQSVNKNLRRLRGNNREKETFFFGGNSSYGLRRQFKDYDVNTIYLV
jgi:RNA polymerase primary sigma factor